MAKEKHLTPVKEKIIANYEIQKQKFFEDGYEEYQETISVLKANIMAFVTAGPFALLQVIIWILAKKGGEGVFGIREMLVFWGSFLALLFVHELLHGLGWVKWTRKKWQSIYLGMMWDSLTPYCHCKEPLKPKHYLAGVLAPFLTVGIGRFLLALIVGNHVIFLLSVLNTLSAGGDTTIACMLFRYLKYKDNCYILDHPTKCGFVAFVKS